MKTTKAFRAVTIVDTAYCPYCEAENDNIVNVTKSKGCTQIKSSTEFENTENIVFECECWECKNTFKVDYFKEV